MRLIAGNVDLRSVVPELGNLYAYVGNDPLNANDPIGLGIFDDLRAWVFTKYLGALVKARDRAKSDPARQQQTKIDQADETAKKAKRPANQPEGKRSKEQQQSSGDEEVNEGTEVAFGIVVGLGAALVPEVVGFGALWQMAMAK